LDEILLCGNVLVLLSLVITEILLIYFIGIDVVAVHFIHLVITGEITSFVMVRLVSTSSIVLPKVTGFVTMEQLASLRFTDASVAEVGTLVDVSLGTTGTFVAVSIDSERATNGGSGRNVDMTVSAVCIGAIAS